jgi:hypothetical protein
MFDRQLEIRCSSTSTTATGSFLPFTGRQRCIWRGQEAWGLCRPHGRQWAAPGQFWPFTVQCQSVDRSAAGSPPSSVPPDLQPRSTKEMDMNINKAFGDFFAGLVFTAVIVLFV